MSILNVKQLLMSSSGCSNFFDSFANWFQKRIDAASDKYDKLIKAMDTLNVDSADQDITLFIDGATYSISDVIQNLSDNDYSFMVNGVDKTEVCVDSIKSELQSNMLYEKAMRCLANAKEGQDLASIFLQMTDGSSLASAACNVRDYIAEVLNNERLDIKNKAITLVEDLSLSGSTDDGVTTIFNSDIYNYTGTHPAILWAIDTFDLDYEQLIQNVAGVIQASFYAIGQIALNTLASITKAVRKGQSKWKTYVEQGGQYFTCRSYDSSHVDNTCEQAYIQLRFPTTSLGKNTLATTFGFTREEVDHVYSITDGKPLIKFDTPFGCIYLGHFDGALGDTIVARVYPKYISYSDDFDYGTYSIRSDSTIESLSQTWSGFNGSNEIYQYNDNGENYEFAYGLYRGRKMLNMFLSCLYHSYKDDGTTVTSMDTESNNGLHWPSNSASSYGNKGVFNENRSFWNSNTSEWVLPSTQNVHILNTTSVDNYVKVLTRGIITLCVLGDTENTYCPYTVENGFYPSVYAINSDSTMVNNFGNMLQYVTYAAIAVVVAIGVIKITKSIRLAYERTQTAYWGAINAGDAVAAAKAAKKARFIGKFTTGVSTSSSNLASGLFNTGDDTTTLIKLIAG